MTQDSMKLVFNLTRFEMQYPEFVRSIAPKIADEEILEPIKSRMKDFGYSEKIINETRIENLQISTAGQIQFDVVSDYKTASGFDVAEAREKGTVRHFIKPINAKALAFIIGGFIKAFSKGHWVKGITASNVITKTVEELSPAAQSRLNNETDSFLQRSLDQ